MNTLAGTFKPVNADMEGDWRARMRGSARQVLVIVVVALAIGWCVVSERSHVGKLQLTLAHANQPAFTLVYLAEELGYFAEEGLDVEFLPFTSGRDALASVIRGEADVATVYETPVVLRAQEGVALAVISGLHRSNQNTALVARTDQGISSPEDLRGKRIGVTRKTNGEFFCFVYLKAHGIEVSEVTLVDMRPEELPSALANGTVDAVATWNPYLYLAEQAMAEGMASTFYSDVYTEMSMLTGTREFVSENKEHFRRLVRGIVRAESFYRSDPNRSLEIVVECLSDASEKSIRTIWRNFKAETTLSNEMLTILRLESDWYRRSGLALAPAPNFRTVIVTEFLQAESPESVTIF